jgi:cold shock CspA family protein
MPPLTATLGEATDPEPEDGGMRIGQGYGVIKSVYPTYGFIRSDAGADLFFIPTGVDLAICRFKELREHDRVSFEIIRHRRGLRAQQVRRLTDPVEGLINGG